MFRGEGYDFIELREYVPGDDTRHIDWNITAKMQRPFVKVFREERELSVVTVAMLGYSAISNGDVFTHINFGETLEEEVRSSKKHFAVAQSVEKVLETELIGRRADYNAMASTLYKRLKRRSLIVVIGDFFEIPDLRLLAKKHEVVAIVVRDHAEEKPSAMGFTALIDPETGSVLEGDFNERNVRRYTERVREHDSALFERFRKDGVRATKLYTDAAALVTLRRLFEGRL
ncbi:MAG: hypothetical protein JU82_10715 [Sulfuricurvum sp. MLSB]|nr:MAG: hypothetical protein JU82_10715 [Sulfuricurvum sp. MLSB]